MKFSKASWLLAAGLAAHAAANDGPVTVTATVTTTTTRWHSTLFICPEFWGTTTVTVDSNGCPWTPTPAPAPAPTGDGNSNQPPAPPAPAPAPVTTVDAGSQPAPPPPPAPAPAPVTTVDAGSQPGPAPAEPQPDPGAATTITVPVIPVGPDAPGPSDVETIGTNDDVFTWTGGGIPTNIPSVLPPVYTGLPDDGSLPEPGSPNSNTTTPQEGSNSTSCNSADDRSIWCDGMSISSDYHDGTYSTGKICSYDLTITNTTIDFDGSGPKIAFAINGQSPGPLIECNWGDVLQVTVHNQLQDNTTSIHWHGLWQRTTNDQDGVPGITECGIAPGSSRTYTMKLNQYGTGWYHSHAMTQYADGVRGPMIIHGPATANYDIDMGTVMIADTFDVTAAQQAWRIAHVGPSGTSNYLLNGKNTLPDLSAGQHALWSVEPGKKHLFRFINSAAQDIYSVHFDNHVMTVIAADYVPIVPYTTEWLNIGIGQRFDVIVEMNQPVDGYFLRAVTQTGCPSSCTNSGLGSANGIIQYKGAPSTLPTSTYGQKDLADFASCLDEPIASIVPFVKKAAGTLDAFSAEASTLPAGNVARVTTSDGGSVFRWYINNSGINVNYTEPTLQTLAGGSNGSVISNSITLGAANQWVYFIIQNQFFAAHPMHLHGHDMSILGQGSATWNDGLVSTLNFDNPPRRDTVMLIGSEGAERLSGYTVIGFETDNPGAWLMHCHIVWHVDGGLALQWIEREAEIPKYANSPAFQEYCAAVSDWVSVDPVARTHSSSESGLKRRTYFDDFMESRSKQVVRRDLGSHLHRHAHALGDIWRPRNIRL